MENVPLSEIKDIYEIRVEYPSIPNTTKSKVDVGLAMKLLGFEHTECSHVKYYRVIPLKAA